MSDLSAPHRYAFPAQAFGAFAFAALPPALAAHVVLYARPNFATVAEGKLLNGSGLSVKKGKSTA
jgi:hypothetical protein